MPAGSKDFPLLQNVQTSRGASTASCSADTVVLSQEMNLATHHSLPYVQLFLYARGVPLWHRQVNLYVYCLGVTEVM